MKRKLLIVLFVLFVGINVVLADDKVIVESNVAEGEFSTSNVCGAKTKICSNTYGAGVAGDFNDGIRVTLRNVSNNGLIDSRDLWFTYQKQLNSTDSSGYKGSDNIESVYNSYCNKVGGKGNAYNVDVFKYADFLRKLDENDVNLILSKFGYNIKSAANYYMVVEPIFKLHYTIDYKHYYFTGTVADVVYKLKTYNYGTTYRKKYALYFVYKDNPNCQSLSGASGKCGNWFVLSNYLKTYYIAQQYGIYNTNNKSYVTDMIGDPNSKYGKGIIIIKKYIKNGNLTINKTKRDGTKIVGKDAKFNIYTGNNCQNYNRQITINGSGTIELEEGSYSLKEVEAPGKYKKDDSCYNFTINSGETTTKNIGNESTCESEFDELSEWQKTDPQTRLSLFNKYINRSEGTPYQLLNFSNTYNPCSATRDCGIVYNSTCTNTTIRYDGFNSNNLSCYSKLENVDNKKAYCVYEYNYDSTFLNVYNKNSFINAGRIIFQDLDNLGLGYLQKRCYSYDGSANYNDSLNYTDYIDSVSILNQKLDYDVSGIESFNNDKEYIGKRNIKYSKINYIEKVSGLSSDRYCIDGECIRVSGIVTRFETDINDGDNFNIDFTPEVRLAGTYLDFLRKDNPDFSNKVNQSDYCSYTFGKQIIKDNKPNLEFRIIDTRNPFPGKTGEGRTIGSNWCDGEGTCTSVGIENYSSLTTIQENIINRTNSDGINGNGDKVSPKYIINLNYNSIKDIREYNNNHDYSNFSQVCDSEQKCGSRFLSDIKNKNYMITTN